MMDSLLSDVSCSRSVVGCAGAVVRIRWVAVWIWFRWLCAMRFDWLCCASAGSNLWLCSLCSVRTRTGVVNTAVIGLNDGDVGSVKLIWRLLLRNNSENWLCCAFAARFFFGIFCVSSFVLQVWFYSAEGWFRIGNELEEKKTCDTELGNSVVIFAGLCLNSWHRREEKILGLGGMHIRTYWLFFGHFLDNKMIKKKT